MNQYKYGSWPRTVLALVRWDDGAQSPYFIGFIAVIQLMLQSAGHAQASRSQRPKAESRNK